MRTDESNRNIVSNGYTSYNGSYTPRKAGYALNGHSPAANGSGPLKNGTSRKRSPRSSTYRGHNREELTRILIQGLEDMGYGDSAETLSRESGFQLESSEVATFRSAIVSGNWFEAERILASSAQDDGRGASRTGRHGLILAEHASKQEMLFWIREQKFLELLVARDLQAALKVLREELSPLRHDTGQLHTLSTLLMCTQRELEAQLRWPADPNASREMLLEHLSRSIAPSVMIRDHRLAELLDQVKAAQIDQCLYHNTSLPPSLYSDHICSQDDFPSRTWMILEDHAGEVYCVAFSPDGTMLATAGEDKQCIIYSATNFSVLFELKKHNAPITHIAWSPDSSKIITSANEPHAHVWDARNGGKLLMTLEHNTGDKRHITCGAWMPDSLRLVTCCHDAASKMCLWNLAGPQPAKAVQTWSGEFRVSDIALTADGQRLICNDMNDMLVAYDMNTYRELWRRNLKSRITSITPSRDSRVAIVNLAEGEIQMIELDHGWPVRKFKGLGQGENIIRNCFGGAAENFVLSGSKDGDIYVWHKENSTLIEKLKGHSKGLKNDQCVTSVSWNPTDSGMFASGGDDKRVRIWTNRVDDVTTGFDPRRGHPELNRESAMRSTASNL